jgi:hypothetical protein
MGQARPLARSRVLPFTDPTQAHPFANVSPPTGTMRAAETYFNRLVAETGQMNEQALGDLVAAHLLAYPQGINQDHRR